MTGARRAALLEWYDRSRRPLPWRDDADPYAVLVSEVMAQQTQISRVVRHFERFLAQFPTVEDLAAAPLGAVLRAWSGLGYNRRARYLHDAAQVIAAHSWPMTVTGLRQLPGVGPYTAAAVACFAFGEAVPAVDTNMRRVLSRWQGRALEERSLRESAGAELDPVRPGDWNQAVMDLGARVCTPRRPRCGACPVAAWCADPAIYTPPARQPAFAGSAREARGAVLKALVREDVATGHQLSASVGIDAERVTAALEALHGEGLIEHQDGVWSLAGSGQPPRVRLSRESSSGAPSPPRS